MNYSFFSFLEGPSHFLCLFLALHSIITYGSTWENSWNAKNWTQAGRLQGKRLMWCSVSLAPRILLYKIKKKSFVSLDSKFRSFIGQFFCNWMSPSIYSRFNAFIWGYCASSFIMLFMFIKISSRCDSIISI